MRRFLGNCGHYRESLCLLASGDLPDRERSPVENHLAACAGCREYFNVIKNMASVLANWEKTLSHVAPDQTVQARWARDFQAAVRPRHPRRFALFLSLLDWCHEMIWPCRRIWTGFAAVWLVLLAINFSTRGTPRSMAMKSARPSPEMVRAYLEREGLLAEWTKPDKSRVAETPKLALPAPRSERRPGIFRA